MTESHKSDEDFGGNYINRRRTDRAMDKAVICSDVKIMRIAYKMLDTEYERRYHHSIVDDSCKKKRRKVTLPTFSWDTP